MQFNNINSFLRDGSAALAKGPIALILLEDEVEVGSTIRHHIDAGFKSIVVFGVADIALPTDLPPHVHNVSLNASDRDAAMTVVNAVMDRAAGQWVYYCYNSEYLFYPFCEHRSVGEMLAYHTEERRDAVLTYVVDLYAGDLSEHPNAVSLKTAYMDKSGYYALARKDADDNFKERQLDFFGGLRWRFEEHIPPCAAELTAFQFFAQNQACGFRPTTRFRTLNTTPMPAPGTTASQPHLCPSAQQKR